MTLNFYDPLFHFSDHSNELQFLKQWKGALNRIIPSLLGHLKNKSPEIRHHHPIYIYKPIMYFAFRFSKTWQITFFSPKKNTWRHSMVFYKRTLKRRESKKALDYHLHLLLGSSPV